jgi:hypothetical protein
VKYFFRRQAIADSTELAAAREATRLISARGYGRDRNLAADLERLIATGRP